jgi:glycosyltransferase involved in cell wall biosynthesis
MQRDAAMTSSAHDSGRRTVVIVLGMHRSGTSVLTRGLTTLGVELGVNLLEAQADNPQGFWENRTIYMFNDAMFEELGSSWDGLGLIDWGCLKETLKQDFRHRACRVLATEFGDAPLIGFKDPRTPRLLPVWQDACSAMGLQDRYVIVLRNPISVARSLEVRNGFPQEKSHLLWLLHVVPSLLLTQGKPRCIVEYDRLMDSPAETLLRVSAELALGTDAATRAAVAEFALGFVSDDLRHSVFDSRALASERSVTEYASLLYRELSHVASGDTTLDNDNLRSVLDKANEALESFAPVLRLTERFDRDVKRGSAETSALRKSATAQSESFGSAIAQVEAQNAALAAKVNEVGAQNGTLSSDLELVRRELALAQREVAMLREERQYVLGERARLREDLGIVRAEHDALKAGLHAVSNLLDASRAQADALRQTISEILASTSWRLSAPIRSVGRRFRRPAAVQSPDNSIEVQHILEQQPAHNDYSEWLRRYDTMTGADRAKIKDRIKRFPRKPLISIVMPVFDPPLSMLEEAIQSVVDQLYPNWELCIADDASTNSAVPQLIRKWAARDARIKPVFRNHNGHISAASNSALEVARGTYIALLDNDDLLSEHALFWVADAIVDHPEVGLIYSDEDKCDESGARSEPYFKSDWNPDLFLSHNMICHLAVYRADLIREVGAFREGYEGAQDYDLALRCVERLEPRQIVHVPRVLYHWRSHVGSTAQSMAEKPYALVAGERALNDHFARLGISAQSELLDWGMYRARYEIPQPAPLVTLVIPTRNGLSLLRQCLDSILGKTTYENYEILIVDNCSDDPEVLEYFGRLVADDRIRVLRDDRPFNFSALNNFAVQHARGEYLGLINNDVEVISPDWLTEMISLAQQPDVGAVGACLWYPNDTLQHGGVILGVGGVAGHSHKGLTRGHPGYFGRARLIQTLSAVTAACLVIRKSTYASVGGFDETNLKIAFNDVDFCLRVRAAGYRNVWTPYAELYHHESATRGLEDTPAKQLRFQDEVRYVQARWGNALSNDPAYSPNLALDREDFSLAWPPRLAGP